MPQDNANININQIKQKTAINKSLEGSTQSQRQETNYNY